MLVKVFPICKRQRHHKGCVWFKIQKTGNIFFSFIFFSQEKKVECAWSTQVDAHSKIHSHKGWPEGSLKTLAVPEPGRMMQKPQEGKCQQGEQLHLCWPLPSQPSNLLCIPSYYPLSFHFAPLIQSMENIFPDLNKHLWAATSWVWWLFLVLKKHCTSYELW